MHQTNPQAALEKMRALLKPGGVLVLQESQMSTMHFSEGSLEYDEFIRVIVDLGKHKGMDFDIGSRLDKLCAEVGFEKIGYEPMEFRIQTKEAAPSLLARIDELRDGIVDAGLSTHEKVDYWKESITRLFSEAGPSTYTASKQGYALAWR